MSFKDTFKGLKDPDQIMDLLLFASYSAGLFGTPMPVDESREVFENIKKLIIKQHDKRRSTKEDSNVGKR